MTKTLCLDTNIWVRYLVDTSSSQSLEARKLFQQAEQGKHKIYLDEVIIAELIWVLTSYYNYTKKQIDEALSDLLLNDFFVNPRKNIIIRTLSHYFNSNLSYVDCWFIESATDLKYQMKTFDKKLIKSVK